MKKQRQLLTALLTGAMLAAVVTGCGGKEEPAPAQTPAETPAEAPAESDGDEAEQVPEETAEETKAPAEKKGVLMMATTTSGARSEPARR